MLTAGEKSLLLCWFGYPFRSLDASSVNYSKSLADSFEKLSDSELEYVRDKIEEVQDLEEQIKAARLRLAARKIDDIETNPDELRILRNERARLVREVSGNLEITMGSGAGYGMVSVVV